MTGRLQGKVAIITGAGSGIGRASALLFASEGARLVLGDKTEAVHDTARAVVQAGGSATALQGDAGVEADVAQLVATAISSYGQLDVAFANAGISGGKASIFELTPEAWTEVLRVNLIGPWLMVKHAGKQMADAGKGGSIICTASVLSPSTRRAPSLANSSALARPMPEPAPVMIATLPCRRPLMACPAFKLQLWARSPGRP